MHGRAWQNIRQLDCGRARDGRQAGRQRQELLHEIRIFGGRPCRPTAHGHPPARMQAQPAPYTASLTGAWAQACAQGRAPAAGRQRAARARGRTRAGLHVAHQPVRERARELGLAAPGVPKALKGVADARPARRRRAGLTRPASRRVRRARAAPSRPPTQGVAIGAAGERCGLPRQCERGSMGVLGAGAGRGRGPAPELGRQVRLQAPAEEQVHQVHQPRAHRVCVPRRLPRCRPLSPARPRPAGQHLQAALRAAPQRGARAPRGGRALLPRRGLGARPRAGPLAAWGRDWRYARGGRTGGADRPWRAGRAWRTAASVGPSRCTVVPSASSTAWQAASTALA